MPREGAGGNGSGLGGRRQSRWLRTADGFAVCGLGQRSRAIFDFHKRQTLTLVGVRRKMVRLHDVPPLQRLARGPARPLSFFCANGKPHHFLLLLRPVARPTRKYLKATRPSPAGNMASHFRQRILPFTTSQASIVTILYSASQAGQRKGIGSDWLIVKRNRVAENQNVLGSTNESGAHEADTHAPSQQHAAPSGLPLYPQGQRAAPALVANPVDHILLFWDRQLFGMATRF